MTVPKKSPFVREHTCNGQVSGEWACTPCQLQTFCWWEGLEEEVSEMGWRKRKRGKRKRLRLTEVSEIGWRRRKRGKGEEIEIDREMKRSLRWDGGGERGGKGKRLRLTEVSEMG